jgi:hypothetical protein
MKFSEILITPDRPVRCGQNEALRTRPSAFTPQWAGYHSPMCAQS